MTGRQIDQMEGGNCVVMDVWCDECLFAWPEVLICVEGDYGEGECPEGHFVEVTFEGDDRDNRI